MKYIISKLKRFLVSIFYFFGLEKVLTAFTPPNYLILNYHGVVKFLQPSLSKNHLSIKQFEEHLDYFNKNYSVVSLTSLTEQYRKGHRPSKPTIAITFDDGYENNFTNAFPLLKQYNFPATIFVTAQALTKPNDALWYDALDLCKNELDLNKFNSSDECRNLMTGLEWDTNSSFESLKNVIKGFTDKQKQIIFQSLLPHFVLRKKLDETASEYWKLLSSGQIIELADSGIIEIGSHGLSHTNMDILDEIELKSELIESKKILEEACSHPVHSIAFPDGAYTQHVKKLCKEISYTNLLAVDFRCKDDHSDPSVFRRFSISNTTITASVMTAIRLAFKKQGF